MFSGKLGAAEAEYQNSDDAGSQSVGQVVGMLGQLGQQAGQMGQQAGAASPGPAAAGGPPQQPRDEALDAKEDQARESRHEERESLQRADDSRPAPGPVPVTPSEQPRHGGNDLGRRM
jgi:ubiquitin